MLSFSGKLEFIKIHKGMLQNVTESLKNLYASFTFELIYWN